MTRYTKIFAGLLATVTMTNLMPVAADAQGNILMRRPIKVIRTGSETGPIANAQTQWRAGDWTWSSGGSCNEKAQQTRPVECLTRGSVVADAACAATSRPEDTRTMPRTGGCQYIWKAGPWSDPVPACGETTQSRTMTCTRSDGTKADDGLCTTRRGETVQPSVDFGTCSYSWNAGDWEDWSSRCSATAERERTVVCRRADGAPSDDAYCLQTRPQSSETASIFDSCGYEWKAGIWKAEPESTQCGMHDETRIVRCVSESGSGAEESNCTAEKPLDSRTVEDLRGCTSQSYKWDLGPWSNDDPSCGEKQQDRVATCRRVDGAVAEASKCIEQVNTTRTIDDNRTCTYLWDAQAWTPWDSTCSAQAVRNREVRCERSDGSNATSDSCAEGMPSIRETGSVYSGCSFKWTEGEWSKASGCGSVTQTRPVSCTRSDGEIVDDASCSGTVKPAVSQEAQAADTCTYSYEAGDWSPWSSQCSAEADRSRQIRCVRQDGGPVPSGSCNALPRLPETEKGAVYSGCGYKWKSTGWTTPAKGCGSVGISETFACERSDGTIAPDASCTTTKPVNTKTVDAIDGCTYSWNAGDWGSWASSCSAISGRTRQVTCQRSDGTTATSGCTGTAPISSETAEIYTGCSYEWKTGDWHSAPYCGAVTEIRDVTCIRSDKASVSDSFCSGTKPQIERAGTNYEACTYAWLPGAWSAYSSTCSTSSKRTRDVSCERSDKTITDAGRCTGVKPASAETAEIYSGCAYKWTTYAWTPTYACSEADQQTRRVECTRIDDVSSSVPDASCSGVGQKPATTQTVANTESCSATLVNGGYESNLYGWNSSAPVEVTTTIAHGGSKSVRMDPNGQLRQYVKTTNGQRYTLTYWAYTKNGLYVNSYGAQGKVVENRALSNSAYQWVFFSGTFTGTGGIVQLGFYHYAPSGGSSWIDDVTVTPG